MVCYIIHNLGSELFKILSDFSPILLLLVVNNCTLPVPLRDSRNVTVFNPPRCICVVLYFEDLGKVTQ